MKNSNSQKYKRGRTSKSRTWKRTNNYFKIHENEIAENHAFKDMSSIPLVVKTTFAPALISFSMRSFVMSASLKRYIESALHKA